MLKPINKPKVLSEFIEKYVVNRWVNEFTEIDERYKKNITTIDEELTSKFDSICRSGIDLQEQGLKGDIKYIYFSLLRTSLLKNKGEFRIDLYDEKWFLDKSECSIKINLDFIYDSLFKHMEELKENKKKNIRGIRDMEIESIMLKEADKYHVLAIEFFKNSIEKLLEIPSYKELKKIEDIRIMAGEYMDAAEIIYPEQENI